MTAADDRQPRPVHEEDRERSFAFGNRWLSGTYEFFWSHLQEMNPGVVSGRGQCKGGGDRFEQAY